MTVAAPANSAPRRYGLDLTKPVLYLFAAVLCVLIVLPLSWLFVYSLTDKSGALTLANFYRLFTESSFYDPLVTTFIISVSSAVSLERLYLLLPAFGDGSAPRASGGASIPAPATARATIRIAGTGSLRRAFMGDFIFYRPAS